LAWRIELTETAAQQLSKLGKAEAQRVTTFLRERIAIANDPRFTG
jgi:mRNA interferase RelE/StbE